jgi:hypothetical protein
MVLPCSRNECVHAMMGEKKESTHTQIEVHAHMHKLTPGQQQSFRTPHTSYTTCVRILHMCAHTKYYSVLLTYSYLNLLGATYLLILQLTRCYLLLGATYLLILT